ncbi:MAG: UPF0175 family protein [Leptospiraceae bacterium]|nr:UPF0175 family protein [Leptospiraceae bacterium]MCP5500417.1 UPF0175 family protein [Leptospiraceae bacterium]
MSTYTIQLPETAFATFRKTPDEFIKELKIAAVIKWYELGEISQNKAAEIAELSRSEFIEVLHKYKVSVIQYTEELLDYELSYVEK